LHSNCAQCHVPAGGGNSKLDLHIDTALSKTNLIDEKPTHHSYGLKGARIVAPGFPDRSVLLHRIAVRGAGQMPQLSTNLVDDRAVELMREWILDLKPAKSKKPANAVGR
jgi:mono/diheme cytochrome c family protein